MSRSILIPLAVTVLMNALPAQATQTLTLMSYNIHSGAPCGVKSSEYYVTERDLANIADVVTSSGADIVVLQEVQCEAGAGLPASRRHTSVLNEPRVLSRLTGMDYLFASTLDDADGWPGNVGYLEYGSADVWTNNGKRHGEFGNALLTRYPMTTAPVTQALPRRPNKEQRGVFRVELGNAGTTLSRIVVYGTHLQHDNADERREQFASILDMASRETSGSTVFIFGDMNQDATKDPRLVEQAVAHGFQDLAARFAHERGEAGPQMTFPADAPTGRIDYIFCNQPLRILEAKVPETTASDHRPIVVRVELRR